MYKKQPLKKRQNKKFMPYFTLKTSYLIMPFAIKTKQKNKVQGSLDTTTLDTLLGPPTLRRSIVLNDSKEKEIKRRRRRRRRRRKKEGVEEE